MASYLTVSDIDALSVTGNNGRTLSQSESIVAESSVYSSSSQYQSQLGNETTFAETLDQLELPNIDDEYNVQFFGFTPKTFSNGIYNAVNFFLLENMESLSSFLLQQFPTVLNDDAVRIGCDRVQSKFILAIGKAFDKLEKYLERNLLYIPASVLLVEDQPHALHNPSEEETNEVDQDIEALTSKIMTLKYANGVLRDELKTVEMAQSQSDAILNRFVMVQKLLKMNGVSDLRESVMFTLEKAQQCYKLVNRVKQLSEQTEPQGSVQNEIEISPADRENVDIVQKAFSTRDIK